VGEWLTPRGERTPAVVVVRLLQPRSTMSLLRGPVTKDELVRARGALALSDSGEATEGRTTGGFPAPVNGG
jgi:hypothetical protein